VNGIHLPSLNAILNATCALLLTAGFYFIKRKNIGAHRICMGSAFLVSIFFLTSYLYYHAKFGSTPFRGQGLIRPIYFSLLITHTILAVTVLPLAITTLVFALKNKIDRHKRLARWTFPIWMYVSVTGVVVYWFLYQSPWSAV